jgi:hypothetical protein
VVLIWRGSRRCGAQSYHGVFVLQAKDRSPIQAEFRVLRQRVCQNIVLPLRIMIAADADLSPPPAPDMFKFGILPIRPIGRIRGGVHRSYRCMPVGRYTPSSICTFHFVCISCYNANPTIMSIFSSGVSHFSLIKAFECPRRNWTLRFESFKPQLHCPKSFEILIILTIRGKMGSQMEAPMRAACWNGNRSILIDEVDAADLPELKEGQVRVAPAWCGICGTDLAEWLYGPVSSCLVVSQSTSCIRTIKLRSMVLSPFLLLFKTLMGPSSKPSVLDQNGRSDLNVLIRFRQAKLTQPPALLRKGYCGRTRIFRHNHSVHPSVTKLSPGQKVAVVSMQGCGTCHMCSRGRRNDCETNLLCCGMHIDGGMADHIVVDAFMCSP